MKKHFKIGEISKLYNIGVDSIRYYEEIGLIKPERSNSGYRYYSIHDIWRLNVSRICAPLVLLWNRSGNIWITIALPLP